MVASRHLLGGAVAALVGAGSVLGVASGGPSGPAAVAAPTPAPVTSVVRLETRPDVARAFGFDLAGFRREAAGALSLTATERFGPLTAERARSLGRNVYFGPADVDLYALPSVTGREDERRRSTSWSVAAVPRGAVVHADGSVEPPSPAAGFTVGPGSRSQPTGPVARGVDPTFGSTWGTEQYFTWARYNVDDGGIWCGDTKGVIRGQWEYARLRNVAASSPYDYWGFVQRAVAEVSVGARHCDDAIDWFTAGMQFSRRGFPAKQDPRSGWDGKCETRTLTVGGSFHGITASITQPVERCEAWTVHGALAPSAAEWYGVTYDNAGAWNKFQRESAALEIVRLPKGTYHGLNTRLDIDVDNR